MGTIKCTVTECNYNHDVMCEAPMIQVNHNKCKASRVSDDTQCDTFKPRK